MEEGYRKIVYKRRQPGRPCCGRFGQRLKVGDAGAGATVLVERDIPTYPRH